MSDTTSGPTTVSFDRPRRGRPRAAEPMQPAMTSLPPRYYERLCALANRHDIKVSEAIRKILILRLGNKP